MHSQKRIDADAAAESRNRMKGIFAGGVILLCLAYLVWALWPKPPVEIAPATDSASVWLSSYAEMSAKRTDHLDPYYMASSRINVAATPDRTGVVISGRVSTPAQLTLLKSEIEKITPSVPIKWEVIVAN